MQLHQRLITAQLTLLEKLRSRRTLIRAAENTWWLLVNHSLRLVGSLVIGVWVARYLGPEQYGLYNYAIAYVGLFATITPLGLQQINVRDLAIHQDERNTILGSSIVAQFAAAIITLVASLIIALWTQQDSPTSFHLILILSLITLLRPIDTITYWWRSQHRSVKIVLANSTSLIFMVMMRAALVVNEAPLQAFAWVLVAEQAIYFGTIIFLFQREGESILNLRWSTSRARASVQEGTPFLLSALASSLFVKGNQIMVKELAGAAASGYFAAASRINALWAVMPQILVSTAMPVISRAKFAGQTEYENKVTYLIRMCTLVGLVGAIAISFAAPIIIPLVFGPKYVQSSQILIIQIWYTVPQSVHQSTVPWIVNEGLSRIIFQKTLSQAVIILVLNYWLIPRFEGVGAAYSLLVAGIATGILWDFIDPRVIRLRQMKLHAWFPWWYDLPPVSDGARKSA